MPDLSTRRGRPLRAAIILTVLVGAAATAVAYFGTRERPLALGAPSTAPASESTVAVNTIVLPHDEGELPSGPNQRTFAVSCTICHSTRLVMTQPSFARKQWTAVVEKMVKTYGAPINSETQEKIVDYLMAVRGN